MPDAKQNKPAKRFSIDYLLWSTASLDHQDVTDEEVAYFRDNPDQIDEVSSPVVLHKILLWVGLVFGIFLTGVAKLLSHSFLLELTHPAIKDFIVDVVFEIGVALLGAAIVTFMIGLSLNQQQARAKKWRKEIRKRIAESR